MQNSPSSVSTRSSEILLLETPQMLTQKVLASDFFLKQTHQNVPNFHRISEKLLIPLSPRLFLLDWMFDFLFRSKSATCTFFLSVNILTRYLESLKKKFHQSSLYIFSLVSMRIASKIEDTLEISEKISKRIVDYSGFTRKVLKAAEEKVIFTLKFDLKQVFAWDFCSFFCDFLKPNVEIQELQK